MNPVKNNNMELGRETAWQGELNDKLIRYKTAIFLGYNYYRLFLAGCLWLLYFYIPDQQFIGKQSPAIFERVISAYLAMNVVLAFIPPRWFKEIVSSSIPAFIILCGDITFFGLQMYSSGGVNGILGNFLIVPVAFSGVLVGPRYSSACAALGFMVCYYAEFNLHVRGLDIDYGSDGFFQAGLLGIALFVISALFQYLSRQLNKRNEEILTLEKYNQLEQVARRTQAQLAASNERFKVLLQSAGEGVLGVDHDGTISFANRRAGLLLECNTNILVGRNISGYLVKADNAESEASELTQSPPVQKLLKTITLPDDNDNYDPHRWQTESNIPFYVEYSCEAIHSESGAETGAVIVFQDITKRKENEEHISRLANFDSLTDLVNRAHFQQALRREIGRAERLKTHLSVMYIDMDRFKYINDTLGHAGGDEILQTVASRLISSVRSGDVVARLGGDEFAIILIDARSPESASQVAATIINHVGQNVTVAGKQIVPSVSIGVASYNIDATSLDALLKAADTALYAAKEQGGNTFRCFQIEMQQRVEDKRRIQTLLRTAVQNDELSIFYQPIYHAGTRKIHSLEALVRWFPAKEGPVAPDVFIPIAEDSGQMAQIGNWVMGEVCRQLTQWKELFGEFPIVAVNISTRQLESDDFRLKFQSQLKQYNVPANVVELELTETAVMNDPEFVMSELNRLNDLGVKISIDDFGTGYSSLDYLRRLPLDFLKIDKTFTSGIGASKNDEELIKLMITMAHTMGLDVIAEGVETANQAKFLSELGCDLLQGYLLCHPKPAKELIQNLAESFTPPGSLMPSSDAPVH